VSADSLPDQDGRGPGQFKVLEDANEYIGLQRAILQRSRDERTRLAAEVAELRAELGRRDDALVQVARVIRAYEASIGEETR
jgi:hypothetical protein